ncbi:bifunctional diguanylate cyclase/phosphodiesterase [Kineococcus sp. NPDC059986]|uniref:putative bifunctional diguanylate cyclase/phosphodiesterase n=1 Tax=Kineococcus sp. NPDC059986 TaxID=3155538 RepID=UPI00344E4472
MTMRRWWLGFLLLGGTLVAWCLTLPVGVLRAVVYEVLPLASAAALVVGALVHRPPRRLPWLLLAAGQLCSATGDAVFSWLQTWQHVEPYPSVADVCYLAAYPLQAVALVLLTRGQRLDRGGRLDVSLVTVAMALPLWIFLVEPVVEDSTAPLVHRLADLSYPLADLVVLALVVRLGVVSGGYNLSSRLLALGALVLPVGDVTFALWGSDGHLLLLNSACWLVTYLLWGAAGLHRSMRAVAHPDVRPDPTGRRRLVLLVLAMLTIPGVLVMESWGMTGHHLLDTALAALLVIALGATRTQLAISAALRWAKHTERLRAEVDHRAAHDALTLLPNRSTALDLLRQTQDRAHRTGSTTGVLVVDVDGLARVNDAHGDTVGDDVLRAVAREVERVVRPGDRVGRLGGDEFVVVVEDVEDEGALAQVAARLSRFPVTAAGRVLDLTCSVGIAVEPAGRQAAATELLHEAVTAAARAKATGGARTWFFDDALRSELAEQAELEDAVRHGLAAGEFVLHHQPVLELASGRTTGFEALIRWHRPGHGLVPPDAFIPVAERSDLICDVGRWVLLEATQQLARWRADGTVADDVRIAVNVSGRHLAEVTLVEDVAHALRVSAVPARCLVVEATETVVLDSTAVLPNLRALRDLGVAISLDDYGTGYTSIEQFRTLPLDAVKIDRSFLASSNPQDEALVGLMVHAAHTFGLEVVAEGVERTDQVALLRSLGCDKAQGYLFSRPVPAEEVERLSRRPVDVASGLEVAG